MSTVETHHVPAEPGDRQRSMLRAVAPLDPQVSIVIPCFEEEATIPRLLGALDDVVARLTREGRTAEVIIVDDGSRDGRFKRLKEVQAARAWLRLVRFRRNYGQTAAMAAGFERARGAYIVPMDADLQNDPDDIPRLLNRLEEGFDVVSGWRKNRQDKALSRKIPSTDRELDHRQGQRRAACTTTAAR